MAAIRRRPIPQLTHQKTSLDAPAYIQKVQCFVLFWRPVFPTGTGPTVRTSD